MEPELRRVTGNRLGPASPAGGVCVHDVRCRIELWRGYFSSTLYVQTPDGLLLESKPFRWRSPGPPPAEGAARAAHDDLVARLAGAGWRHDADGPSWYATTFVRKVATPSAVTDLPVLAAAADPDALVPDEQNHDFPSPRNDLVDEPDQPVEPVGPLVPASDTRTPDRSLGRIGRGRRVLLAGAGSVAAGVALLLALSGSRSAGVHSARSPVAAPTAERPASATAKAAPASVANLAAQAKASATRLVNVRIVAHGRGSWIEARLGSSNGRILYSGVLAAGGRLRFRESRLWVQFGAAGNVSITADGRPVKLSGTYDKLFGPGVG